MFLLYAQQVELKSGELYRGTLVEAEDNWNCQLTNVSHTARDGKTFLFSFRCIVFHSLSLSSFLTRKCILLLFFIVVVYELKGNTRRWKTVTCEDRKSGWLSCRIC